MMAIVLKMSVDLFAGTAVSDLEVAVRWYTQLLGASPVFRPNDAEAVFELAPERHLFLEARPVAAGHARHLIFVDDLDSRISSAAARGLAPSDEQSVGDGVRKISYTDPDGNLFEFGGASTP
jgi:catechol 2,3-dioxygenase-like lactoylglutathione lyase family enzyme